MNFLIFLDTHSCQHYALVHRNFHMYEKNNVNLPYGNTSSTLLCLFSASKTDGEAGNWRTVKVGSWKSGFLKKSKFPHFHFFPKNLNSVIWIFHMSLFHLPGRFFGRDPVCTLIFRFKKVFKRWKDHLNKKWKVYEKINRVKFIVE